jgi:hypothetical protein
VLVGLVSSNIFVAILDHTTTLSGGVAPHFTSSVVITDSGSDIALQ